MIELNFLKCLILFKINSINIINNNIDCTNKRMIKYKIIIIN